LDALVEIPCLFLQRHGTPVDERHTRGRADPDLPALFTFLHRDVADLVVEQPPAAVEILPPVPSGLCLRIKARRALVAAEPDRAGFLTRKNSQVVHRAAFGVLPDRSLRFGAYVGWHVGSVEGKMAG